MRRRRCTAREATPQKWVWNEKLASGGFEREKKKKKEEPASIRLHLRNRVIQMQLMFGTENYCKEKCSEPMHERNLGIGKVTSNRSRWRND
ncbi:hypothetical protein GRJ2_001402200 [Grus japonensis]|uniref:Uncharacterized protein n=1 Tax=Grus japonensis TaxID=30415 RepID=A0ABC9WX44_GRUJA